MIVVEGPDGSGKSTLVAQLSAELKLPVAPRVVSAEAKAMTDMVKWTEKNLEKGFQPVIYDRHRLISGMIYAPLLRGKPDEGFDNMPWLKEQHLKFQALTPVIIVCLPPLAVVRGNIGREKNNRKLFPSKRAIDQLYWLYYNWTASHPGYIIYDYTNDDYVKMRNFVYGALHLKGLT